MKFDVRRVRNESKHLRISINCTNCEFNSLIYDEVLIEISFKNGDFRNPHLYVLTNFVVYQILLLGHLQNNISPVQQLAHYY